MNWIIELLLSVAAVMLAAYFLPGVELKGFGNALLMVILLGLANLLVKPLLLLLTLPITIITLGLFIFVVNALVILLVEKFVPGLRIRSLGWAILYGIVISLARWGLSLLVEGEFGGVYYL